MTGPTIDTLDNRATRLEVEFAHVRRDLDDIKTDLKDMRREVQALTIMVSTGFARLPTRGWLIGIALAVAPSPSRSSGCSSAC
jgi:hypothetical protein